MSAAAPAIHFSRATFTLADRLRIQQERITRGEYRKIGVLTTIVLEQQMSTRGLSQSRALDRCSSPEGVKKLMNEGLDLKNVLPFSPWQSAAWVKLTLEWLHWKKGSTLAVSIDRNDLLFPMGLAPLPDIPDPAWVPKKAGEVPPRIAQRLEDRACGQIRDRKGKLYLVIQPLTELAVAIGAGKDSGFGKIKCATHPADHLHTSLLVHPYPGKNGFLEAYIPSGSFHAGF